MVNRGEAEHLLGLLSLKETENETDCSNEATLQREETNREHAEARAEVSQGEACEVEHRQTQQQFNHSSSGRRVKLEKNIRPRNAIQEVDTDIFIDPSKAVVKAKGQLWLIPEDIAEMMVKRANEPIEVNEYQEQFDVSRYDDYQWLEEHSAALPDDDYLEKIDDGKPGYWVTVYSGPLKGKHLPVYGYMADHGRRAAAPPRIKKNVANDWESAEWLCRCAQCGRELPPAYFFKNTSGKPKGICRGCTSINRTADTIYSKARRYWRPWEKEFMVRMSLLYNELWAQGLAPRGKYACYILGEADVKDRIAKTRHYKLKEDYLPRSISESQINSQLSYIDTIMEKI